MLQPSIRVLYKPVVLIAMMVIAFVALLIGNAVNAQTPPPGQTFGPAITSISLSTSPPASPPASPTGDAPLFDVQVSIEVSGFSLVDKVGQENVEGEGHIIYYYAQPPTFPLYPAYSSEGTFSQGTTATTFVWRNSPEPYDIYAAQLVNNDDTPLNPPVYAVIVSNLLVPGEENNGPAITSFSLSTSPPSSPEPSPEPGVDYFDVIVTTEIVGFELISSGSAETNVQGQGHNVYYQVVDPYIVPGVSASLGCNYSYSTSANPFTFLNYPPGYQSFFVQLVNNDDTPLDLPVYAGIKTNLPAGQVATTTPPSPQITVPGPTTETVTIDLTAQNTAFNLNSISVPAGSEVTINFNNMENGIQHNFAVYTNSTANEPIFVGDIITGPSTISYTFTAPAEPGDYFFRCDVHPTQMFGLFIVTP